VHCFHEQFYAKKECRNLLYRVQKGYSSCEGSGEIVKDELPVGLLPSLDTQDNPLDSRTTRLYGCYAHRNPTSTSSILPIDFTFLTKFSLMRAYFSMNWYGHRNAHDTSRWPRRGLLSGPSPLLARQKLTYFRPVRGFLVLAISSSSSGRARLRNLLTGTEASASSHAGGGTLDPSLNPALTLASVIVSRPKSINPATTRSAPLNAHLRPNFPLFAFTPCARAVLSLWLVTPLLFNSPIGVRGSIFRPSFCRLVRRGNHPDRDAFVLYPCRLMIVRSRT